MNSVRGFLVCLVLFSLSSCRSSYEILSPQSNDSLYSSIVIIIHGDGDYRYHDQQGRAYLADEVTLAKAESIASKNVNSEVFIYHQKPLHYSFLFFPVPDGDFYYYRHGILVRKSSYRRDQGDFSIEAGLYERSRKKNSTDVVRLFLYFGHEVPEFRWTEYDASYPERDFTTKQLAVCLSRLTAASAKFNVVVLSTCYNGTPYTISALSPYAEYIITSPEKLHLSYFDLTLLDKWNHHITKDEILLFAKQFSKESFDRLTDATLTAITVALYDVEMVQEYLRNVDSLYKQTMYSLERSETSFPAVHCDCGDIPAFVRPDMNKGVTIHYRPPQFGRSKNKQHHSGWECWEKSMPDVVLQNN